MFTNFNPPTYQLIKGLSIPTVLFVFKDEELQFQMSEENVFVPSKMLLIINVSLVKEQMIFRYFMSSNKSSIRLSWL